MTRKSENRHPRATERSRIEHTRSSCNSVYRCRIRNPFYLYGEAPLPTYGSVTTTEQDGMWTATDGTTTIIGRTEDQALARLVRESQRLPQAPIPPEDQEMVPKWKMEQYSRLLNEAGALADILSMSTSPLPYWMRAMIRPGTPVVGAMPQYLTELAQLFERLGYRPR